MSRKAWGKALFSSVAVLALGFAVLATGSLAKYRKHGDALLNDLTVTPGVVRTTDIKIVCGQTTGQFRNTTEKMKNQVYAWYGVDKAKLLPGTHSSVVDRKRPLYEIDHLISLELGGADDVRNLWPQPYYEHPGAREKDLVENYLHKRVCAGEIKLADAQKQIAEDWYAVYLQIHSLPAGSNGAK